MLKGRRVRNSDWRLKMVYSMGLRTIEGKVAPLAAGYGATVGSLGEIWLPGGTNHSPFVEKLSPFIEEG
jgi:hypothetical protein